MTKVCRPDTIPSMNTAIPTKEKTKTRPFFQWNGRQVQQTYLETWKDRVKLHEGPDGNPSWLALAKKQVAKREANPDLGNNVNWKAWMVVGIQSIRGEGNYEETKRTTLWWFGGLRFSFNSEHIGALGKETGECDGLYVHRFLGQTWTH